MSISFACPECKVQIEVGDEFAGQSGQCPRCQQVIGIPSPNMPKAKPASAGTSAPMADPWVDPRDERKPRSSRGEGSRDRTRRPPPAPRQPAGPIWPWVVGIAGAVVVVLLLFTSFIVLVSYRRPEPPRPIVFDIQQGVNHQGNGVAAGHLLGQCAIMQDGVFQIHSQLNNNDPFDREQRNSRAKRYEIDLIGNIEYVFELESNQFDGDIRLENLNNGVIARGVSQRGLGAAIINFQPGRAQHLIVCVTNPHAGVGDFTLTIREQNRPKPFVP